ncbi:hypothetical protein [Sinanaerobacter sp. ZZT-01]|uniref:hypothetical protein n=1 Tax=Sinanaerobacter sp. ZZT-01 TaxID=3111540 RepID=UPI002D7968F5|nr:hypothetical protein [Sinanaerobacter sp. ZZT-01]WRR94196.1 hypothetical protein U5921_03495 [Sinanaerobacter sp. ZZT-01]
MEKFFKILEESCFHKECVEWDESLKKANKIFNEMCDVFGIEAQQYVPYKDAIAILPTEKDEDKFGKVLKKDFDGIRYFKKNSELHKWWCEKIKQEKVECLKRPSPGSWISCGGGRFSTRLFDIKEIWYGSYSCNTDFKLPDGLKEMKASEFYKMIEDHNESLEN